ncbi:MAG TPA: DEAD/DEAH box helicase family protein, partial [Phytomonospora sp.]
MPFASSQKSVSHALEVKVAGVTVDALGRKWDPSKHPRDSRGRFIETGGIARVGLGGLGKVVRSMAGGKVEVQMGDGSHRIVPHQQLTMVRRPDGSKPTASVRKVVAEDASRDKHPGRGDGKFDRDTNPDLNIPEVDPADEDHDNPDDTDADLDGIPDAYTPSRQDPRAGDLIAVTAVTKDGKAHTLIGKIDHIDQADNTKPDQVTLAGGKRTRLRDLMAMGSVQGNHADYTVLPFEDLNDPAALIEDARGDDGKHAVMDNETAADLVEGHAKATTLNKPKAGTPAGGRREGDTGAAPVTKDDLGMGRKPGTVTIGGPNGRIVGRIEKDPENPGHWKVTDRWGRTKKVGQKWDTGRTALARMLNNPPKSKDQPQAAPNAPEQRDIPGRMEQDRSVLANVARNASDSELDRAIAEADTHPNMAAVATEERDRRNAERVAAGHPVAEPAPPANAGRDYAGEYREARLRARSAATLSERGQHEAEASKIERAARRAGVDLDVIELDEEARQQMLAGHKPEGHHSPAAPETPAAPESPAAVEKATKATAAKQKKSLTRIETSAGAGSKSPSGLLVARTSGRSNWSVYRKVEDHTPSKDQVLAGDYVAEMGPKDEGGATRPVAYYKKVSGMPGGLQEFRDQWVGGDQDRPWADLIADAEAKRDEENDYAKFKSDFATRVAQATTPEELDALEHEAMQHAIDNRREQLLHNVTARRGVMANQQEQAAEKPAERPAPARLPEGAAPQKPNAEKPAEPKKNPRLPEGAAPQKPKAERPTPTATPDYPESTSPEGAPHGTLRANGADVLGDVPAQPSRDDQRQDGVLHRPVESGRGADRADAPDAAVPADRSDAGTGDRGAQGAAAGGDGERAGRPGVPAAGAGDRGPAAAGDRPGRVGDEPGDHSPAVAADAAKPAAVTAPAAPAKKPTRTAAGPSVQKNLDALRALRAIESEGRPATAEEKKILAQWAGWGALPKVFDESDPTYADERAELKDLLGEVGWRKARTNMLNAHYTDPALVASVWDGLKDLGFTGGNVLEPGAGSGNFIGQAPKGAHMVGVEVEPVTAGIAHALHPDADIHLESFAKSPFRSGVFDAVIGNVPFGQYALQDRKHNRDNHSIHNHFIIKSLDTLKPGGVMAVVSSSFTLDSQDDRARQAMYAQADLVGAVRLPEGAHEKAAGTSVVTDVLLFRKRLPGEAPGDDSWLHTSPAVDKAGNPVVGIKRGDKDPTQQHINDYFTAHPDDLLGEVKSGGYNGLKVVGEKDPAPKLRERLAAIAAQARKSGRGFSADTKGERVALRDAGSTREGRISFARVEKNAKGKDTAVFERIEDGRKEQFEVPATQADEFKDLLELRDLYEALMASELEAETNDDDTMTAARAALNNAYRRYVAKYGPVTRYTVTEKDGTVKTTYPPVMGKFRQDEGAAVVFGLESGFDPETGKAKPADVLTSRQLNVSRVATEHTDDPNDAIALAAERPGGLSNQSLAHVLQTTPAKARAMVKGLVFNDPEQNGQMVSKAAYLSGNVRKKLAAAEAKAAEDEAYAENVDALRSVLPADATLGDIPLQLGSAFIGPELVSRFLQHLTRNHEAEALNDEGQWRVPTPKSRYGRNEQLERSTWGTDDRSVYQLVESILKGQHRIIRITRRNEDGSTWVDKKASEEAALKAQEIEQEFQDWVWANPDVGDALSGAYTLKHRSLVPRTYDDAPQRAYPGMAEWLKLRPHQNAAVTRGVNEPAVLLEHVVGAGKTYELAALAMELRRLGMSRKPVLTVPNHMLAQWTKEFREAYPNAKILAADSDSLSGKENRKRFASMAANNDWDVVLMTHTAFESIPTSREWEEKYLYAELDRYQRQLSNAAKGGDKKREKQIQTQLQKLEKKIKDRLERRKDDDGITFETIGFDYVMADEAHVYKNLDFQTGMQGIQSPEGSGRARDMHMKLELLRSQKPSDGTERIAAFATGTPISNSLAEMYTMTRFMRPDLLDEAGVGDFDSWAATFATVSAKVEQDTSANGWVERVRMRGFTDALGDALRIWRTFSDTKTAKDLNLPRPELKGGERKIHVVEPSEAQMEALASFKNRVETLPSGRPQKGDDTHVAIIGDGRRAAIDPRLMSERGLNASGIDPDDESIDSPKIDAAAANILRIWRERGDDVFKVDHESDQDAELTGALQMVMIDSDAPKKGKRSSYQMLKDRLVAGGIPADQIRFVQEAAGSSEKKAKLFEDARQGKVAVLMGSTAALGTGTNVQNRLYALHHIDGSWKPSDIEQREGRILRQGNQYPEVEIHAYVTERTHDVKTWDMTAYKQAALDAIAHGSYDMRGVEFADDVDPLTDYDTITGMASGDPLVQDRRDLAPELKRLRNAERSHRRQIDRAKGVVQQAQRRLQVIGDRRQKLTDALARREDISGDNFKMSLTLPGSYRGQTFGTRKEAAEALKKLALEKLDNYMPNGRIPQGIVGTIGGFDIRMSTVNESGAKKQIALELTTGNYWADPLPLAAVTIGENEALHNIDGALSRLENRVNGIESAIGKLDAEESKVRSELGAAEQDTQRRFRFAQDLADAERREQLLDKLLTGKVDDNAGESMPMLRQEYAEVTERTKNAESRAKAERMAGLKAAANAKPDAEPLKVTPEEQAVTDAARAAEEKKPAAPAKPKRTVPDPRTRRPGDGGGTRPAGEAVTAPADKPAPDTKPADT